ncbi:DUF4870 family protein [Neptunicella sp. SCSIO 80796]|uniref:DUF4870 family protein n=1 Tax=Neptunicella plasticusilytica TaxID=3117012 RepID=UPI003A4D9A09
MTEQNLQLSQSDEQAKTNALIAYLLMLIGIFTGIFWLIGGVWGLVKRDEARRSIFADHYDNISTTFWWVIGLSILGGILTLLGVGVIILFITGIWAVFRIVKGLAKLTSNRPYQG